jgi:glycosyltransferase involved in cell wall biosynthesis
MSLIVARRRPAEQSFHPSVCLFTDSEQPSGVGEHMLTLANKLAARFRFSLICPTTSSGARLLARARIAGLEVLGANALRDVADWHRARDWLQQQRVDLLHVHAGITWEGLAAPNLARAAGVPAVLRTEHLPFLVKDTAGWADYLHRVAEVDRVICVSNGVYRSFAAAGTPPSLLAVVPNGIDPPVEAKIHSGVDQSRPIFLTVARLSEQKALDVLIEAAPHVLARAPAARFRIVGTGPLEGNLIAAARALGVADGFEFLGHREDVPALMTTATAFVLPSRFEGLPLALLEAMARTVPVVATDVCGNADAVEDAETGLLVPPYDPQALAAALLRVIEQPLQARIRARRARKRVLSQFTSTQMARATLSHYASLTGVAVEETAAGLVPRHSA